MLTSSAKNKGRKLQQWLRGQLILHLPISPRDVKSTSMGASGADVQLSDLAYDKFPYSIECKNQEKVNVWKSYKQAESHADGEPLLIIKKNGENPLAVVDAEYFVRMHKEII